MSTHPNCFSAEFEVLPWRSGLTEKPLRLTRLLRPRFSDMTEVVFHIGFHKTATTWLQSQYFAKHPDIRLLADWRQPSGDEFLRRIIGSSDRNYNAGLAQATLHARLKASQEQHASVGVISAERLSGHPFSGGYDNFRIAERLFACVPNAKVIAVVRNQFDMISSVYKQLVNEGYRGNCRSLITQTTWKGTAFTAEMYEYDLLISKYRSLFGEEKVLFTNYEFLRDKRAAFLAALSQFLEIPDKVPCDQMKKVNESMSDRRFAALRILNQWRRTELNPFPIKDIANARRFVGILSKFVSNREVRCDELRDWVRAYYTEPNARFERLSGIDLNQFI